MICFRCGKELVSTGDFEGVCVECRFKDEIDIVWEPQLGCYIRKKHKMKHIKIVYNKPQKMSFEEYINMFIDDYINTDAPLSKDATSLALAYATVLEELVLFGVVEWVDDVEVIGNIHDKEEESK